LLIQFQKSDEMTLSESEKAVLSLLAKHSLVRRSELISLLANENNGANMATVRALMDRGFVGTICPLGESSYILTKEGARILKDDI